MSHFKIQNESNVTNIYFSRCVFVLDLLFDIIEKKYFIPSGALKDLLENSRWNTCIHSQEMHKMHTFKLLKVFSKEQYNKSIWSMQLISEC